MSNKISSERIGEYTCPDCNQSMCLTQDNLRNHKCMKKLDVNNHGVLMSWRKEIRKKVKDWDKNYTGQDKDYQTYIKNMFLNAYENKLDELEKQNKQLREYAQHKKDCWKVARYASHEMPENYDSNICTCGKDKLIKE